MALFMTSTKKTLNVAGSCFYKKLSFTLKQNEWITTNFLMFTYSKNTRSWTSWYYYYSKMPPNYLKKLEWKCNGWKYKFYQWYCPYSRFTKASQEQGKFHRGLRDVGVTFNNSKIQYMTNFGIRHDKYRPRLQHKRIWVMELEWVDTTKQ